MIHIRVNVCETFHQGFFKGDDYKPARHVTGVDFRIPSLLDMDAEGFTVPVNAVHAKPVGAASAGGIHDKYRAALEIRLVHFACYIGKGWNKSVKSVFHSEVIAEPLFKPLQFFGRFKTKDG